MGGANPVAASRHGPLFQARIRPHDPRDPAIVFYTQQYPPPLAIAEGDEFSGQFFIGDIISLEFDEGILAISDQFQQFGVFSNLKMILK